MKYSKSAPIAVGDYVHWQPHHGNQPRGRARNCRIVAIVDDQTFLTADGRTIKKKHIMCRNLSDTPGIE